MPTKMVERGNLAMRSLLLESNQFHRRMVALGLVKNKLDLRHPALSSISTSTPGGLEISETGDFTALSYEYPKFDNGVVYHVKLEVDFPPDMRERPAVRESTLAEESATMKEVPDTRFYAVAGQLSSLIKPYLASPVNS